MKAIVNQLNKNNYRSGRGYWWLTQINLMIFLIYYIIN